MQLVTNSQLPLAHNILISIGTPGGATYSNLIASNSAICNKFGATGDATYANSELIVTQLVTNYVLLVTHLVANIKLLVTKLVAN